MPTYYVAKTGDNGNPGTSGSPWLTINKAATEALPGDTVIVSAGTYSEVIFVANHGSANNRITFQANGEVIVGSISEGFLPLYWAGDQDDATQSWNHYVTIDGFIFDNIVGTAIRASTGWWIKNCTVRDSGFGVNIRGHEVTVENCTFLRINSPQAHALVGVSGANIKILNNTIREVNSEDQIVDIMNSGVVKFLMTTNLLVKGNLSELNHGPGFWLDWNNITYSIEENIFRDNQTTGIWIEGCPNADGPWARIINNQIYGNVGGSGIGILESNGILIRSNYLYDNGTNIEFRNLDRGTGGERCCTDMLVTDNIFGGRFYDVYTSAGIWDGYDNPQSKNIIIDRNYYESGINYYWIPNNHRSLAAVQSVLGFETNPVVRPASTLRSDIQVGAARCITAQYLHNVLFTVHDRTSQAIQIRTANYTATSLDNCKKIVFDSSNPTTLILGPDLPAGWHIGVFQKGTGRVTIISPYGTLLSRNTYNKTAGQYAYAYATVVANSAAAPVVSLGGDVGP